MTYLIILAVVTILLFYIAIGYFSVGFFFPKGNRGIFKENDNIHAGVFFWPLFVVVFLVLTIKYIIVHITFLKTISNFILRMTYYFVGCGEIISNKIKNNQHITKIFNNFHDGE